MDLRLSLLEVSVPCIWSIFLIADLFPRRNVTSSTRREEANEHIEQGILEVIHLNLKFNFIDVPVQTFTDFDSHPDSGLFY